MYYVHRIFYLDYYRNEQKLSNCGFVKMDGFEEKTKLQFSIRNLPNVKQKSVDVYISDNRKDEKIGSVEIQNNCIFKTITLPKAYQVSAIIRINILFNDGSRVCYVSTNGENRKLKTEDISCKKSNVTVKEKIPKTSEVKKIIDVSKEQKSHEAESVMKKNVEEKKDEQFVKELVAASELPDISDDKWEQLKNIYPIVHIFGEDVETILIRPQDLVILPEKYQNLATNSFLLHGYYNYKQLLLSRWSANENIFYYVGVPGTYYDREKNIAVMFGFESFENGESSRRKGQNDIYAGRFGYYMKKVEI